MIFKNKEDWELSTCWWFSSFVFVGKSNLILKAKPPKIAREKNLMKSASHNNH